MFIASQFACLNSFFPSSHFRPRPLKLFSPVLLLLLLFVFVFVLLFMLLLVLALPLGLLLVGGGRFICAIRAIWARLPFGFSWRHWRIRKLWKWIEFRFLWKTNSAEARRITAGRTIEKHAKEASIVPVVGSARLALVIAALLLLVLTTPRWRASCKKHWEHLVGWRKDQIKFIKNLQ